MNDEQELRQKIVIVEDNFALADIYKTRLGLIGYKCYVATDGAEALEIIEKVKPDLVLLDLMILKIAGGDVLKQMRATSWGKNIRVYIISNLNEEQAPPNLRDDEIDKLVDKILTPPDQDEGISLEG